MTIAPLGDIASYDDGTGLLASAKAVVPINPDGTPAGGVRSSVATLTVVASVASAAVILAANAARKGATILNTDANALYLLFAASGTPSATNLNAIVPASTGFFEVPAGYTGAIRGIWASDGSGSAFVTEFTV